MISVRLGSPKTKSTNIVDKHSAMTATWMRFHLARSCDPWAVHSAKRLEASGSQGLQLNEIQSRIIDFLRNAVEAEPAAIWKDLQLTEDEFKRETAALRHMERIRGRLKDGKVILRLWETQVDN